MKLILSITIMVFLSSCVASGAEVKTITLDAALLEKNISSCPESIKKTKHDDIEKMMSNPESDTIFRMTGSFMTKYVQFSKSQECTIGLLDNAILILGDYLQSGRKPLDSKMELALAKMMRAAFMSAADRLKQFQQADSLMEEYIQENPVAANEENGTPYYFASHAYIDGAALALDEDKIYLLDKAIAMAHRGKQSNINLPMKQQLDEPLGVAFGNKAKYYKNRDEAKYKSGIKQSMQFFEEGYSAGDNLAAYNLAVSYSLLNDAENTKKWLLVLEEKNALDEQICFDGLVRDADLDWFRKNQQDWLAQFFRKNCRKFLPKSPQ